jgi:N-acetylmuramoyl-L-alanine amidase
MGHYVVIEPGDYLAALAAEAGFPDWQPIWDAAENQALRDQGRTPDCLAPGDRVFIPDRTPKDTKVSPGKKYQAKVKRGTLKVRLALRDFVGNPRKGASVTVTIDGKTQTLTADDDGKVEVPIDPGATSGQLVVGDDTFELAIGHLDPVSERSGVIARLRNLGYLADTADDGMDDVDPDALAFAVELFQAHGS